MAGIRTFLKVMAILSVVAGIVAFGEDARAESATKSLTVGATPSLKAALQEIVPMFESEYGATVRVVYGPSQIQRQQIEKGAPIDVFLPASFEEVERLHKKGLTLNGGPRIYTQTSLVLVTSAASSSIPVSFGDALPNRAIRIALGNPKTSALGEITAQALTKLDPAYKNRARLLYANHAEDIVDLVRTGAADVGIVYRADAISNGQVRIIDEAPAGMTLPIQFGEAVVWTCRDASLRAAEEFFDFVLSPRIQKLLHKHGFESVSSTDSQG